MAESGGGSGGGGGGGLQAAGKIFDFAGSILEGYASKKAHDFNAEMATRNAGLVRQQALIEVDRIRRSSVKEIGSMRANYGAQGVTASGSVLDSIMDSATQFELDAQLTKWQGDVTAAGLEAQASAEKAAGQYAMVGGVLNGIGGLLG